MPDEDDARLETASVKYDQLVEDYDSFEQTPEGRAKVKALDAEIDAISAKRSTYALQVIANGCVFVILNYDGTSKVERGSVRVEDEALTDP